MHARSLDLICLGRAAVDLYGEQIGARLEDMSSFAKYLGGCAANIAVGTARQGLKVAMLTRVGDEHLGRFVREQLAAEGVDVSHVLTDPQRLTGLAILGIKDRDTFPLIFYRENCADMALAEHDFSPEFIASARALLVIGTHFSTPGTEVASRLAMRYAKAAGTKVILDIDYRPVLWGLTGRGQGEIRYVPAPSVSQKLQSIIADCDLVVGTEEEFHIAGGSQDTLACLRTLRALSQAVFVVKRGPLGASVFPEVIPASLNEGITVPGVRVEVLNVLGAGDAFMSGLLRGWLSGAGWEQSLRYANACGALVVSRHGCAPAMPTRTELDDYLARAERVPRPDLDMRLQHLHRVTTRKQRWDEILAFAFDHRAQFESMAAETGADPARIPVLKGLLAEAAGRIAQDFPGRAGVLVDGRFGQAVLEALTGRGLWIGRPLELPGSRPLRFECGPDLSRELRSWPQEHVVKCLCFYHPDDAEALRAEQESSLLELYRACCASGHELLVEIIPPRDSAQDDATLARALARLYDEAGIRPDWWKLPPMSAASWAAVAEIIASRDPHCRGVVLLGLDAPEEELAAAFREAAGQPVCRGFAVGRSIFGAPSRAWFAGELNDAELVRAVADNYRRMIGLWQRRDA